MKEEDNIFGQQTIGFVFSPHSSFPQHGDDMEASSNEKEALQHLKLSDTRSLAIADMKRANFCCKSSTIDYGFRIAGYVLCL